MRTFKIAMAGLLIVCGLLFMLYGLSAGFLGEPTNTDDSLLIMTGGFVLVCGSSILGANL